MKITVLNNQSLLDIAIMVSGSAEAAYNIALENGISITDDLMPGQVFQFTGTVMNKRVVDYCSANNIKPATGYKEENYRFFDETFDYTFE